MKAAELLTRLRKLGVELWADGERLRYRAPTGVLTPDLRAELAENKTELLGILSSTDHAPGAKYPPLKSISRGGELPLSFAQERLWFLEQLEPDSPAYNIALTLRVTGPLDAAVLGRSFNEIIRRHEVLRTVCSTVSGYAVQRTVPNLSLTIPVVDLREHEETDREREAQRLAKEEIRRPFDLARGPLLRVTLLRIAEQEHVLVLTTHHYVADGWSMRVLFRELGSLYEAFERGDSSPLAELPLQYVDFAHWQRQAMQGEALAAQLEFWKKCLDGAPPVLKLPVDHPRPPVQTYRGATHAFTLDTGLSARLRALSRQERVTLFMTLLAAFQTLLHRYTQQADIIVGTAVSARNQVETEELIGTFANNLVLRTEFSSDPTFHELVAQVREGTLGAYANQDLPFEKLLEELDPARDMSYTPLFQVMFTLHQTAVMDNLKLPNLTLSPFLVDSDTARLDLSLTMFDGADDLTGELAYSTDLFDDTTIRRMSQQFQTLLEGIVADPSKPVSELPLMSDAERRRLLVEWNDTRADYPRDSCIHELFEAQVEWMPDAVAVEFEGKRLSYGELNHRANQLGHYLRTLGTGPDKLVGIYVERSLEMMVALLGTLKAGAAYVPLDPTYPRDRIDFMLKDSGLSVLLTQQRLLETLPEHGARAVCMDTDWPDIGNGPRQNLDAGAKPADLAYVIYTSGSTGKPKGVQIQHRAAVNFLSSMRERPGLESEDVMLAVTSLSFDIALLELFLPIIVGAKVVIASIEAASDGRQLQRTLAGVDTTVMQATPATWRLLLEAGWPGSPDLKILCGGEALPSSLAEQLVERSASLWNMYGPTETTVWSTIQKVEADDGRISIGRPIANTEIYILDPHLHPVPVGVPGVLYIGGDGLALGYLDRPELTAQKYIDHPFNGAGERIYNTGDLARYLPDGRIECLGRIDHQVKIRGFRIELGEIEAVLSRHPAVSAAAVLVREAESDDSSGPEGMGKQLVAYIVSDQEIAPPGRELRRFMREKLPEYMIPSIFVVLETLPLTPNGKVDRDALPAPDRSKPDAERALAEPRTPVELEFAAIWSDVLGIESISTYDNFFDLGGHSLLSMQVVAGIEERLGVQMSPRELMFQTLGQLAAACEERIPSKPVGLAQKLHHALKSTVLRRSASR